MATIYLTLSAKADTTNLKEIRVRFKHGTIDQQAKSNIFIQSEFWDSETQQVIIPNFRTMTDEKKKLKQYLNHQREKLTTLTSEIHTAFNNADKKTIPADWLKTIIDKYNFPAKYETIIEETPKQSFFDAFDEFLTIKQFSPWRNKAFYVVCNTKKVLSLPPNYNNIKSLKITEKIISKNLFSLPHCCRTKIPTKSTYAFQKRSCFSNS
jgi:hypothetical protein